MANVLGHAPTEEVVMNMRRLGFSALLALAVSFAVAPATRAASEESKERAARKACLSGNVQKGVEILSDLFVKTEDPVFIFNQGRCFEQNGRCEEAINRFREYLRKAGKANAEDKADAEKHIADCQALMGHNAASEAKPEPAPKPTAETAVTPKVEALSAPPVQPPPPPPAVVTVPPAQPPVVTEPAPSPGRGMRIAGIACGIVGVGAIATGIYFYTRARSYSDKVSNQEVVNPSDDSAGKNAETMQWVFYGVGGAAVATGVVLYVLGARAGTERVAVAPWVGGGVAGLSAQGAF